MLLMRSLPPQFLLPAWSARQLAQTMQQRAHKSTRSRTKSSQDKRADRSGSVPLQGPSLFEELFPEEANANRRAAERRLEKLPAFKWDREFTGEAARIKKERESKTIGVQTTWGNAPIRKIEARKKPEYGDETRRRREASVLVLSAVSKTLEESDFFRLSPRGEHIEGWTSGITKVIPARDLRTLERLGYYFILFSSEPAARAYLDNMIRLHKISRLRGAMQATRLPAPAKQYLKPGENLEDVLRGFSLVPSHGRLSLRMLSRPYTPHISQLVKDGGHQSIVQHQNKAEDVVLFSADIGHITEFDLKDALGADGKRRNMQWRLAGGDNDIVKINNVHQFDDDEMERSNGEEERASKQRSYTGPAKYMIAFKDRHEARRFVREWHRRPFPLQRGHNFEDEEPPIVNAEILW